MEGLQRLLQIEWEVIDNDKRGYEAIATDKEIGILFFEAGPMSAPC